MGLRQVVAVADPELIQQILRNRPKLYRRLSTIEPVTKELGVNGVFSAEGEDWKRQRRTCDRACHKQIHAVFTESELAREYASTEALAAHPKIARFVEWIARQPPTADISVRRKRA